MHIGSQWLELEIGAVEEIGADWDPDKVLVGHVREVNLTPPMPTGSRLPTVDLGNGETATVVCGAPNVAAGPEDRLRPRGRDAAQQPDGQGRAPEGREDQGRPVVRHGVLGARAGSRRRPRRHPRAGRRCARGRSSRGRAGRRGTGRRGYAEQAGLPVDSGGSAGGRGHHRRAGHGAGRGLPGGRLSHSRQGNRRDRGPRPVPKVYGRADRGSGGSGRLRSGSKTRSARRPARGPSTTSSTSRTS